MKKGLVTFTLAVMIMMAAAVESQALVTKLNTVVGQLQSMISQPMKSWQVTNKLTKEQVLDPQTPAKKFQKAGQGYIWSTTPEVWIRTTYTVPEKVLDIPIAGTKIGFSASVEDKGDIYVNGELKQSFDRSAGHITLTDNAKPGEIFYIAMKVRRNGNYPGVLRKLSIDFDLLGDLAKEVSSFSEAFDSLDTSLNLAGEKPEKWRPVLDEAADAIDVKALSAGRVDDFRASMKKCFAILAPLTKVLKQYTMMLVAYSHIDPAWLWDKAEGEHIVWQGTSEGVLALQKDFPDFVYAANQMHCYRWMEKDYPDLFKRILADIKRDKWEPVGAEWVEPDGNLPSGESYVRQFMYGRKYSKEKLGVVSTIGWTPDSFGYNWNLPQILAKSDMRGFVTQKISWNDTTRFPYNLFWWQAPDGSKTLVYFPQGGYGENVTGSTMVNQLANMKAKHGVNSNLVIYGMGDHGGGIPRDYVERAYAFRESPIYPNIEFMHVETAFDDMFASAKKQDFPTWNDELYLEYHRGTYTTQSNTKNNNRRNEIRLMNSERFSTIASIAAGQKYAFDVIEEAWKILLFNQFHDILPGSSITPVYKDADIDHAWVSGQCKTVTDGALNAIAKNADTTGDGAPLVLFNGLSWSRDDVVETPIASGASAVSVFDNTGKEIPVQIIKKDDGSKAALFLAKKIPAMGFSVYRIVEGRKSTAKSAAATVSENKMDNEFFTIKVDPENGWVSSIYDKKSKREVIVDGQSAFELQAYKETASSDAWDPRFTPDGSGIIPPKGSLMEMPNPIEIRVVENGPVRVTIMAHRKFGEKTDFKTYYSLVAGSPIVYGRLDTDWQDRGVFLKSAFNLNLDADVATFEIPYAAIDRVTKAKTPGEKAKWEMSGHRWVDYTNKDKKFGATLLSFSKYGYDVKDNVLRMTMLRSPSGPDPEADRGFHSIPLALYPHAGAWAAANSQLRGAEYNDPLFVVHAAKHAGKLGKSRSFFSAGPDNVTLATMKKAENGDGFILRLVETTGKDTTAVLNLPAKPKKIVETNLVERELKTLPAPKSATISVPIGHYEIKTLRVVF
ncbi:MAG: glycoside hydrolase family 38 C-terminal domain-containing protein [bacterium]